MKRKRMVRWVTVICTLLLFCVIVVIALKELPNQNRTTLATESSIETNEVNRSSAAGKEQTKESAHSLSLQQVSHEVLYENKVTVLTYHHISETNQSDFTILPQTFREHMDYLYHQGYQPISLSTFESFLKTGRLKEKNAVLITFDDGYESFYQYAYPILQAYQFPAIQFVVATSLKDSPERLPDAITPLSLYQINQMKKSGLVSFQSHTFGLHFLQEGKRKEHPATSPLYLNDKKRIEGEQEYRQRLYVDFTMSKSALHKWLDQEVTALSFPYGLYNQHVIEMAKKAGYQLGFSTQSGVVTSETNPYLIPRNTTGQPMIDVDQLQRILNQAQTTRE